MGIMGLTPGPHGRRGGAQPLALEIRIPGSLGQTLAMQGNNGWQRKDEESPTVSRGSAGLDGLPVLPTLSWGVQWTGSSGLRSSRVPSAQSLRTQGHHMGIAWPDRVRLGQQVHQSSPQCP